MIAARLLADVLGDGGDLRAYEVAWHRRRGGLHAAYDALRRWNQDLDPAQVERLVASGILEPRLARAGLDQLLPAPSPRVLLRQVRALAGEPTLRGSLAAAAARAVAARALGAIYPRGRGRGAALGPRDRRAPRRGAGRLGGDDEVPGWDAAQPAGGGTSSYAS